MADAPTLARQNAELRQALQTCVNKAVLSRDILHRRLGLTLPEADDYPEYIRTARATLQNCPVP